MVINRTKQLARKVRSPPDRKVHEAKMRDAIAARHGTKRPAVGGVTQRARIKARKRGSRGKTTRKANTESDVSGDNDSDIETVYSYSLPNDDDDVGLFSEDVSVSSSKMSDFSSWLDVDGDNDTSLYGEDASTPKLSDHEMSLDLDADTDPSLYGANDVPTPKPPDNATLVATPIEYVSLSLVTTPKPPGNKTAVAAPVENVSSSIDLDADTDPSLYGASDVPTQNLSDNETSEAAPDGQEHILIEAEIDSWASHDKSMPRVVTQTQALPSADADDDVTQTQAVPPADADEDAIVLPNSPSKLPPRDYTPFYVKAYPTNKGAQYWLDEIPDPVFPVPQDTNFKPPYANWKGRFKNMLKYGEDYVKYKTFFKSKAPKTTNEDLITANIGTQTVTIKDLKTLAPETWLNNTIVDRTTDLLASMCAKYNAKNKTDGKVAVFDSRFTALIIEHPKNSDPPCYNYSRMVG
jgi:hypothetical protein